MTILQNKYINKFQDEPNTGLLNPTMSKVVYPYHNKNNIKINAKHFIKENYYKKKV